jgi:hypothetical protein
MKNFIDTIGNRTHNLPVCSAVPKKVSYFRHYYSVYCQVVEQPSEIMGVLTTVVSIFGQKYSRINSTKSPISGAGNVREPRQMSQDGIVPVNRCVSAIQAV